MDLEILTTCLNAEIFEFSVYIQETAFYIKLI